MGADRYPGVLAEEPLQARDLVWLVQGSADTRVSVTGVTRGFLAALSGDRWMLNGKGYLVTDAGPAP